MKKTLSKSELHAAALTHFPNLRKALNLPPPVTCWYCRVDGKGWRYLKADGVVEKTHPGGRYVTRTKRDGKLIYIPVPVGVSPKTARAKVAREDSALAMSPKRLTPAAAPASLPVRKTVTLADEIEAYISHLAEGKKAQEAAVKARHQLTLFTKACPGVRQAKDITPAHVVEFLKCIRAKAGRGGKRMTERTAADYFNRLRSFMKNRGVSTEPIKDLLPQFTEREPDPYKQSEVDALFAACSLPVDSRASYTGEYMRVAVTLMLRMGLREQEAACGTWDDCDLTTRLWNVRDNPSVGFIIKDKTERAVPIPRDALTLLEKWKKTSKAERPKGSLVLGLDDGNRVNGHLLRWLQALAKRAGMKSKIGLHRLRKTYITGLIRAKVDVPMVQQFVGHSDYASTKRYIGVATPEEKVAVIDSIKF